MPKANRDRGVRRIPTEIADEASAFLFTLGNQFTRLNNAEAAFDCFKYSVDLRPAHQPSVYNLASLYNVTGDRDSAYRMFKEAIRMDPTHNLSKVAMAEVCRKMGRVDEAMSLLEKVLAQEPDCLPAISAQSILYYDMGRLAEASEWNAKALDASPHDTHLMLNKALLGMTYGRWPEFWSCYEECLSYGPHNGRMRNLNRANSWQGDTKEGKTLLVVSDQGNGDAIQFGRFLGEARKLGNFKKLVYLVQPDVKPIVSKFPGVDEAAGFGERERIERDEFTSLLGIMRVLRVAPDSCSRDIPVMADPLLTDIWQHRIEAACPKSNKLKVALCWGGDPMHGNDTNRSISLAQLLPLTQVDGIQLLSFQVGKPADQLNVLYNMEPRIDVPELGSLLRDYADTAAALSQIDLLITVDTSILHLAGAMGVRTFALITNPPEWRWGLSGSSTNWYPSVELFRQTQSKDWTPVINAVKSRLIELAASRTVTGAHV